MDGTKFDNLSRMLGAGRSRRQVLKGLFAGGAVAAVGMVKTFDYAAAQCLDDGLACSAGADCCSGNCDASTGYCFTPDLDECIVDGEACAANGDCCSGRCDVGATNVCFTPDDDSTCLDDGAACSEGRDCCSGNCDATTGYCAAATGGTTTPVQPASTNLPATGSGSSQTSGASNLLPVAALGAAAAVVGAHRIRASRQDSEV